MLRKGDTKPKTRATGNKKPGGASNKPPGLANDRRFIVAKQKGRGPR